MIVVTPSHQIPKGRRIALLGGSFDPPHIGHIYASQAALRYLGVDEVWWVLAPHNPLKPHAPRSIAQRRAQMQHLLSRSPAGEATRRSQQRTATQSQSRAKITHAFPPYSPPPYSTNASLRHIKISLHAVVWREHYTYRLLPQIVARHPQAVFIAIAGADVAGSLRHYRHTQRCLAAMSWVFLSRPLAGPSQEANNRLQTRKQNTNPLWQSQLFVRRWRLRGIDSLAPRRLPRAFWQSKRGCGRGRKRGGFWSWLQLAGMPLSSSLLRSDLHRLSVPRKTSDKDHRGP